jgi:peptidoglycan/xylan/chitin deacetylase (PgdA/CDA1 family)
MIMEKNNGDAVILLYHRVIGRGEARSRIQAGMVVYPDTFEQHLRFLQEYFTIVSLDTLNRSFRGEYQDTNGRTLCVITFDDGWADFYKNAYPVLNKYGICATVFLATGFIGTGDSFWTDKLTQLCYKRKGERRTHRKRAEATNPLIDFLENGGGDMETRLERSIKILKELPQQEINRVLGELSVSWGIDPIPLERDFLTWDEVREMHGSGLISFGSHTESHRILTTLRGKEIDEELRRSRDRLLAEGVVDSSFLPFAYPNGNYTRAIAELVRKRGYSLAVTTRKGWMHLHEEIDEFGLNRIGIHQDMASTDAMFGCRILQII